MRTSPAKLRRELMLVAFGQSGYFTAKQAVTIGYSYQAQRHHVSTGNWDKVDRGLFRIPDWPYEWEDQFVRWRLWSRDRAVISHETALYHYDLGDTNTVRIHVTVPRNFRMSTSAPEVRLHHSELPETDVREGIGYHITTPIRSLLDVAAGHLNDKEFHSAVDDALRRGHTTRRELRERSREFGDYVVERIEDALDELDAA
jgi:predicted transcriptional regulator of viral defense system